MRSRNERGHSHDHTGSFSSALGGVNTPELQQADILTQPMAPISQAGGLGLDPNTVMFTADPNLKPTHDAEYWAEKTRGFDFSGEDRVPKELYNNILWEGLKGTPAPAAQARFSRVDADDAEKDGK